MELETNYLSLVSMTQGFAPVLKRNGGGAFINVVSALSWVSMPLVATYSASKAAAWSFTNAARIELKLQGTLVVAVYPGPVDTEMTAAIDLPKITPAAVAEATLDALQAGEPEALVDDFGRMFKAGLSDDQATIYPQIEREFLAAVGAGTAATGGDR
jgi:short-subunit dehydrogenase